MCDLKENCVLYADDAMLIASLQCKLQALNTILKDEYEIYDLRLIASKTKVVVYVSVTMQDCC